MESGPGSQGDDHSRGLKYPSPNWRSLNLQRALMFVMITTHFQWVASKRNENITVSDSLGPWDKDLFKVQRRCSDFHWKNRSTYFYYWPEDDPDAHFDHCCASNREKLEQYTYGIYGPKLDTSQYYDLGLIDQCLPYWKCYHLIRTYFRTNINMDYCETRDLQKLYKRRFVDDTVLKHGLLESAIPLIVSLEILVFFFVAYYWCIWPRPANGSRPIVKVVSRAWFRHIRKTLFVDWTHLCLLAIIGNGLIEAVGRQGARTSQSKAFHNYARLYIVLLILVWYSSVQQQIAYAIAEIEIYYKTAAQKAAGINQATPASAISDLEDKLGLDDDWKWQPIAAQAGILFSLWGFLTYSADEDTTGAVFGIIVSAACPWSGVYASKVIVRAFPWLHRRVYRGMYRRVCTRVWSYLLKPRRNYRGLWRSVLHLQQWPGRGRGARHSVARPENSAAFMELVENDDAV